MTTPHEVDRMRDRWLDPGNEFDDNSCPSCYEGEIEGDGAEAWCTNPECGFVMSSIP